MLWISGFNASVNCFGDVMFQIGQQVVHRVLEHLLHSSHHEDYEAIEVETLTLPSIMERNNLQHIDFLKMDCEGSEGVILRSTPKDYLQRVRKIAMEFHDHLSPLTHAEIQQLLEEAGFLTQVKWDQQSPVGFLYGWRI